jgi:phage-related protein
MIEIEFYRISEGKCPVEDYLDTLLDKQVAKVLWTLRAIRELDPVPSHYLKKLKGTDELWEVRVIFGGNIFRILGFYHSDDKCVLVHGFTKKTEKTPQQEIATAEARKKEYENRT